MKKILINEATGAANAGKVKVPLVLAPRLWQKEPLEPFVNPVSEYISAMNAYDSYDGEMERSSEVISQNEKKSKEKAKKAIKMFSQNDQDGNPMNGYSPKGSDVPGTRQPTQDHQLICVCFTETIFSYLTLISLLKAQNL